MANKFFNTIKSAFIVTQEDEKVTTLPPSSTPIVQSQTVVPQKTQTSSDSHTINQKLIDKLCEQMENVKQGGVDYLDLKQTTTDKYIVDSVPDEQMRFGIAFRTLQISQPELTKQMILESIDYYVSKLKTWEKEAIDSLNLKRKGLENNKKEINSIDEEIAKLVQRRTVLENEANEIEAQCNQNEFDMVHTVSFLVNTLNDDKDRINRVLN